MACSPVAENANPRIASTHAVAGVFPTAKIWGGWRTIRTEQGAWWAT